MIEVICGPMKSGKTEELIRRVIKSAAAGKKYIIFKPKIDTRTENYIVSRNSSALPAVPIDLDIFNVMSLCDDEDIVCFDETQFFNEAILHYTYKLANINKRVIISGLDMDYLKSPFGFMPELLSIADKVDKLTAVCDKCKSEEATFTKRIISDHGIIMVGDDIYEARCRGCYEEK